MLRHFGDRKSEPLQALDILATGIGEVASRNLSRAFEQVARPACPARARPGVHRPSELVRQRPHEQRRIGGATGDHDVARRARAPRRSARRRYRRWPRRAGRPSVATGSPVSAIVIVAAFMTTSNTSSPETVAIAQTAQAERAGELARPRPPPLAGLAAPMLVTMVMPSLAAGGQHGLMRALEQRVEAARRIAALAPAGPARSCARRGTRTPGSRASPCSRARRPVRSDRRRTRRRTPMRTVYFTTGTLRTGRRRWS